MKIVQIISWMLEELPKSRKFSIIVGFKEWIRFVSIRMKNYIMTFMWNGIWNPTILRRILKGGYLLLLYFQR